MSIEMTSDSACLGILLKNIAIRSACYDCEKSRHHNTRIMSFDETYYKATQREDPTSALAKEQCQRSFHFFDDPYTEHGSRSGW